MGNLSLLRGSSTQVLNPGLLHCRWILHQLRHKGSPVMKCSDKSYNIGTNMSLHSGPMWLISLCTLLVLMKRGMQRPWDHIKRRATKTRLVWKSLSHVRLQHPMDCSLPGSSVHGILQARILEWVAVPFSRGSSQPRDWTQASRIVGRLRQERVLKEANPQLCLEVLLGVRMGRTFLHSK